MAVQMPFRLSSLLLLAACAFCVQAAHGTERAGDATHRYELQQNARAGASLEKEFLSLIEAASSEERFYLYWTYNHLTGSRVQVEYLQTQLELAIAAQSYSDEEFLRAVLPDQAQFVHWQLG